MLGCNIYNDYRFIKLFLMDKLSSVINNKQKMFYRIYDKV